jgi:formiminotetrahydrofolate cyclodeaminase
LTTEATAEDSAPASYADHRLGQFVDRVAARESAPGGGAAAAVSVALAAGLTAMAARFSSRSVPDSESMAETADDLRRRALQLADDDSAAYRAVLAAGTADDSDGPTGRSQRVRDALTTASKVPLEVCELGAETVRLAALLAAGGNPRLRGDAVTAVLIAEAGVHAAARLVSINVAEGGCDEELARRASRTVDATRTAAASLSAAPVSSGRTGL